ncbi:MAG: HypC/HybG/HupF family hydrogenase formation chaperone [Deltaproteobacteria bacterium]|nr:HypC/HybG/HupF family hydrogenase formation chaperone [Deltaproteobacteria bacterium]
MCIAFPGKIISLAENGLAIVEIGGIKREVCIDLLADEVQLGDYVISHAGYAIQRVDEAIAKENLALLKEILDNEAP